MDEDVKVIFLDFDGVLNSRSWLMHARVVMNDEDSDNLRWHAHMINPALVVTLNHLIDKTGAKVVISSTWRRWFDKGQLQELLEMRGFKHQILDVLPLPEEINMKYRGEICNDWLDKHPEVTHHLCIDDDVDAHMSVYVRTAMDGGGLTVNAMLQAIELLTPGE